MGRKILVYGCSAYARNTIENLDIDDNIIDFTDSDDKKKIVRLCRKWGRLSENGGGGGGR